MTPDTTPTSPREPSRSSSGDVPSPEDTARRVLDALRRSAVRARRVAAQTGTRLVVVRDGELVIEPVTDSASVTNSASADAPVPESPTDS